MIFTKHELDRIADETYAGRNITASLFCARCGYNLKTLPYVHRCPECGSDYNARPLSMKGIFFPRDSEFPFGPALWTFLLLAGGAAFLWSAAKTNSTAEAVAGGAFLLIALLQFIKTWKGLLRFWHIRELALRIAKQEEEGN